MKQFLLSQKHHLTFFGLLRIIAIAGAAITAYFILLQWQKDYHSDDDSIEETSHHFTPASRYVTLENDLERVTIDTNGGALVENYLKSNTLGGLSVLSPTHHYSAASGFVGKPPLTYVPTLSDDQRRLTLDYQGEGYRVQRVYQLNEDYQVSLKTTVFNDSPSPKDFRFFAEIERGTAHVMGDNNGIGRGTFFGFATYSQPEGYDKYDLGDVADGDISDIALPEGYFAFAEMYYATAWAWKAEAESGIMAPKIGGKVNTEGESPIGIVRMAAKNKTIPSGAQHTWSLSLYSGPKIAKTLDKLHPKLDLLISYGWFWPVSKLFHLVLTFFAKLVGNWGVAIMLLTLSVKIVLFPLNQMSYRSMAKMRAISPKMQRLREQYGDDKSTLSKETMALYRQEGVNPMGGCLPMLLQIPIFIGLFWMIRATVELRGEPFFLWVHDLSQIDHYFILPILMGIAMVVQQHLNPAPTDPTQAKMVRLMPYGFTLFFLWFPSALTLYWVTNNTLTVLQQWYITRTLKLHNPH